MSDYKIDAVDPKSPYAREMMARPISDAADLLTLTAMMAIHYEDITSERIDELDGACADLTIEIADLIKGRAKNRVEGHLLMGQVAINLVTSFIGNFQEAYDLAMLQMDLEDM